MYYQLEEYQQGLAVIDSSEREEASILQEKAEIFRKLKLYHQAIDLCAQIILKYPPNPSSTLEEIGGVIQAHCCKGYCFLETGKKNHNQGDLQDAKNELAMSINIAQKTQYPIPPRAFSGLGYIYEALGEKQKAALAFAQALDLDQDNPKALDKTS